MEIKKKNLVAAYNTADGSSKKMLQALFPEAQFETPQTADDRPVPSASRHSLTLARR